MRFLAVALGMAAALGTAASAPAFSADNVLLTILGKYETPETGADNGYRFGFSQDVGGLVRRLGFDPRQNPEKLNLNTVHNYKTSNSNPTVAERWALATLDDWASKQHIVEQYAGTAQDYSHSLRLGYGVALTDVGEKLKKGNIVRATPPPPGGDDVLGAALLGALNSVGGFFPAVGALTNVYLFLDGRGDVSVAPHGAPSVRMPSADVITMAQSRLRGDGEALFDAMDAENAKLTKAIEGNFGALRAFTLSGSYDSFDPNADDGDVLKAKQDVVAAFRREIWRELTPLALELDAYPDIKPGLNAQPCPQGPGYTEHEDGKPYLACKMTATVNDCCGFALFEKSMNAIYGPGRPRPKKNQFGIAVEYAPTYYAGGFRGEWSSNPAKYDKPFRVRTTRRYIGLVRKADGVAVAEGTANEIVGSLGLDGVLWLPGLEKGERLKQSGSFMPENKALAAAGGRQNDLYKYLIRDRPQVAAFLPMTLDDVNIFYARKRFDKAAEDAITAMQTASGKFHPAGGASFGDARLLADSGRSNLQLAMDNGTDLSVSALRIFEEGHIENHPAFFRETMQAFLAEARARAIYAEGKAWMEMLVDRHTQLRDAMVIFETFPDTYREGHGPLSALLKFFPSGVRLPVGLETKAFHEFLAGLDPKDPMLNTKIRDYVDGKVFTVWRQSFTPLQESQLRVYLRMLESDRLKTTPSGYMQVVLDKLKELQGDMAKKLAVLDDHSQRFNREFETFYRDWDQASADFRSALRTYQIARALAPAAR
ncbi:MAG: hypothetical protein IPM60_17825 [Rhodospirillales bacterium]|nr:hypothetical protein [Rhodospirillales bacterium]